MKAGRNRTYMANRTATGSFEWQLLARALRHFADEIERDRMRGRGKERQAFLRYSLRCRYAIASCTKKRIDFSFLRARTDTARENGDVINALRYLARELSCEINFLRRYIRNYVNCTRKPLDFYTLRVSKWRNREHRLRDDSRDNRINCVGALSWLKYFAA